MKLSLTNYPQAEPLKKDCLNNTNKKQISYKGRHENNDPLLNYPLRGLAYTNEVGAALAPIPGVGPTLFKISWVPALMYFGADIYDKYAKGKDNDYSQTSHSQALRQAVFQGLASIILPMGAILGGQTLFDKSFKYFSKDKMSVGQMEDVLSELKRAISQDKLKNHQESITRAINYTTSLNEAKNSHIIKDVKKNLLEELFTDMKAQAETVCQRQGDKGTLNRIVEFLFKPRKPCANLAKIKSEKFDEIVKPYLKKNLDKLIDTRIDLQSVVKPDGIIVNENSMFDKKLLKKIKKGINKAKDNRDITDKAGHVIKQCILDNINKVAMKASTVKIIGGFAALVSLAVPIDVFVENVILKKYK